MNKKGDRVGAVWYADHALPSQHHPETGECLVCPVQVQCRYCEGTGRIVNGFNDREIAKQKEA